MRREICQTIRGDFNKTALQWFTIISFLRKLICFIFVSPRDAISDKFKCKGERAEDYEEGEYREMKALDQYAQIDAKYHSMF